MARKKIIYTVGHSTHSTKEFMEILKAYKVEVLVDVRHYPGSRYCPQFGKANLRRNLKRNGFEYVHLLNLGGRRRPDREMHLNDGWRSPQFRGYADYMQSTEFKEGLAELIELASLKIVAIMCSEAVPWRCHRSLIGDALLTHKFSVLDLFNEKTCKPHGLTSFAKVTKRGVIYPAITV